MADILGVSESMYSKYEQGQNFLQPNHFQILAQFNVNLHYLIAGVGPMFTSGRPVFPPC